MSFADESNDGLSSVRVPTIFKLLERHHSDGEIKYRIIPSEIERFCSDCHPNAIDVGPSQSQIDFGVLNSMNSIVRGIFGSNEEIQTLLEKLLEITTDQYLSSSILNVIFDIFEHL